MRGPCSPLTPGGGGHSHQRRPQSRAHSTIHTMRGRATRSARAEERIERGRERGQDSRLHSDRDRMVKRRYVAAAGEPGGRPPPVCRQGVFQGGGGVTRPRSQFLRDPGGVWKSMPVHQERWGFGSQFSISAEEGGTGKHPLSTFQKTSHRLPTRGEGVAVATQKNG